MARSWLEKGFPNFEWTVGSGADDRSGTNADKLLAAVAYKVSTFWMLYEEARGPRKRGISMSGTAP